MSIDRYHKGKRVELKAVRILESQGYIVDRVVHTRWSRKDFFNLFDIVCKNTKGQTKWIQVKSSKVKPIVKQQIKQFKEKYGNVNESYEIWVYKMRKGFEIIKVE